MVDLPAPERPVNHSTQGFCPLMAARARLVHVERLPVHVAGAPEREVQHAGADRVVGDAVDEDEAAGVAVDLVGIEGDRAVELEVAHADLVQVELARRPCCCRVLTLIRYLSGATVAVTVLVPIFRK